MDSAAVFLFTLFYSDPQWTRSHAEEIRRTLGPYPASVATRAREAVKRITSCLEEKVDLKGSDVENSLISSGFKMRKKEFGHAITFNFDEDIVKKKPCLAATISDHKSPTDMHSFRKSPHDVSYDSLSDSEENRTASDFITSTLLGGMATTSTAPHYSTGTSVTDRELTDQMKSGGVTSMNSNSSACLMTDTSCPYTAGWLREKCKECMSQDGTGMSWQDLFRVVFEHLSSPGDNTAIQNDVRIAVHYSLVFILHCFTSLSLSLTPHGDVYVCYSS